MQKPIKIGLTILSTAVVIIIIALIFAKFQQKTAPTAMPTSPIIQPPTDMPASQPPISNPAPDETSNWQTYTNEKYGFEIKYPADSQIAASDQMTRVDLTFNKGTTLQEKYLQISWKNSKLNCSNPSQTAILNSKNIGLNGISFKREEGEDRGAGNIYYSISYSTTDSGQCIELNFILHSANPDNFNPPLSEYDLSQESKVFDQILSTFKFTK